MTTIIRIMVLTLTVVCTTISAQDFQGIATYKTQRAFDVKMDSTQMNSEKQEKMMAMMKKQFEKTYNLTFNREESVYKQEMELDKPQVGGGDFQVMVVGNGGGADVLYKNTKDGNYADKKDTMGKIFLVKDSLSTLNWKLENETKYIGDYLCFKASFTKMVEKRRVSFSSNTTVEENESDMEEEPEMEERTVTAWYTPQIPVNNGPVKYQGLPGLILEVHDGKLNIICSKIVLNPKEKIEIEAPNKGKKVDQAEYDKIMEKKAKEMMERYAPRKGGRKGESIEITIGG